jgi:hypothetical protein
MAMRVPALIFSVLLVGCSDLKHAETTSASDAGTDPIALDQDGGGARQGGGTVTVEPLIDGRSRLGARSSAGFRPWRTGIAVNGDTVYWVESGTTPGLYSMPASCAPPCKATKVATLTRPASFAYDASGMLVADTTS